MPTPNAGRSRPSSGPKLSVLSPHAGFVYDARAAQLKKKGDWQGAANVYGEGVKRYPANEELRRGGVAVWEGWVKTYRDKSDWASAIEVYEKGLKGFPDSYVLKNNLEVCRQRMKR